MKDLIEYINKEFIEYVKSKGVDPEIYTDGQLFLLDYLYREKSIWLDYHLKNKTAPQLHISEGKITLTKKNKKRFNHNDYLKTGK